ncbi:hypothetical protein PQE68_gp072 [Bacillus phage vB_BanS_Sophrita]|uniref:Uncharacterized protein n=1 Tax=Bacillus phage vB_BanS_Sophrita TaxID=2894790 RepID=A0AAE8YTV6_9CAUD|nr:hypothetical protein PQE68_gp072 [Bacillus phage vB_BanS_Sophrita]UGO50663.1 hypothetical protein SOPHRITA_72 [Bacillus phage vB_BanS_Sophrita]
MTREMFCSIIKVSKEMVKMQKWIDNAIGIAVVVVIVWLLAFLSFLTYGFVTTFLIN